ncbi:MAG: GHKL domain-containing protein [Planctomycetales bacterium]|nr:GHKL domain-containing protein [Planctomycetales bacterium]
MMFNSLRSRLLVLIGATTLSLFMVCAAGISLLFESSLWSEFDSALKDRARSLGQLIEQEEYGFSFEWLEGVGLPAPITANQETLTVWCDAKALEVLPPNAQPIPLSSVANDSSEQRVFDTNLESGLPARAIEFRFAPRIVFEADEDQLRQLQQPRVSLVFARTTADIEKTISRLRWTMAFVGLIGIIATLGTTWFAVGFGLSPLQSTTRSIAAIRAGTLGERLDDGTSQPQELRPLINTINQLLSRLEKAFARERSFSADVAHELRTPLAGLRAQLDLALSRPRSSEEHAKTIRNCLEITTQTGTIIESLLETTKHAAGESTSEDILLHDLISGIFNEFEKTVQSRQLSVVNEVPKNTAVHLDRQSLTIILRNFIENAVSHADAASQVCVRTIQDHHNCKLAITNCATTFHVDDIEKVFDRFWRADTSRHETGRHSGLGLSLCQRLAERCGASLHASCVDGLFTMELVLPIESQ